MEAEPAVEAEAEPAVEAEADAAVEEELEDELEQAEPPVRLRRGEPTDLDAASVEEHIVVFDDVLLGKGAGAIEALKYPKSLTLGADGSFSLEARPGHAKLALRSPSAGPVSMMLVRKVLIDQQF